MLRLSNIVPTWRTRVGAVPSKALFYERLARGESQPGNYGLVVARPETSLSMASAAHWQHKPLFELLHDTESAAVPVGQFRLGIGATPLAVVQPA